MLECFSGKNKFSDVLAKTKSNSKDMYELILVHMILISAKLNEVEFSKSSSKNSKVPPIFDYCNRRIIMLIL